MFRVYIPKHSFPVLYTATTTKGTDNWPDWGADAGTVSRVHNWAVWQAVPWAV